jgi:hypothetical protein
MGLASTIPAKGVIAFNHSPVAPQLVVSLRSSHLTGLARWA